MFDVTQIEIYLMESGIALGVVLGLGHWLFRKKADDSKSHPNAGLWVPILWMGFGAFWIYLRAAGFVSLPW